MFNLLLVSLLGSINLVLSSDVDCSSFDRCIDCVLRSECGWQDSSQVCGASDDANANIFEGPGCPEYEPVAIVSFDTNEQLSYTMTYDLCSKDFDKSLYTLEETEDYEFDKSGTDSDHCESQNVESTFYVKSSNDDTMTYELYGKITALNGDTSQNENNQACNIIITHGAITSMTCVLTSEGGSFNDDKQATTLYGILQLLLPRMDYELFENTNNIMDETGKGTVLSTRQFKNNTNETVSSLGRNYNLNNFELWQSDVIPLFMYHDDTLTIDDNNNHITDGYLNERFVFNVNDASYSLHDVTINLVMTNEELIGDPSTVFADLYDALYVSSDYGYVTKVLTSHDWHKGQFDDSDYNLNIDYGSFTDNNNERRRMLHIEEIYSFTENLFTSPSIFGVVFSGDVEGTIGIDCLWNYKTGVSLTDVYSDAIPVCPPSIGTCAFSQLTSGAITISDLLDIVDCCESLYVDLGNCDETQADAEAAIVSCISAESGVCGSQMSTWIDSNFWTSVGSFVFFKDKYCNIDCLSGGGITGHVTLALKVNGNTLWDITFNFDKSSEFSHDYTFDIFEIEIPIIAGVTAKVKFEAFIEWGMTYDELNDGNDYVEVATPYFKAGITLKASLGINIIIASAHVGVAGKFTLIDFEYPIEARLVGFLANPVGIPNLQINHQGNWNGISFEWWIFVELCFIGFCDEYRITRRRNLLEYYDNNQHIYYIGDNKNVNGDNNNKRALLGSYSEAAHDATLADLDIGGYWILDSSDIIYNVNAEICFTIYANDDLEDYIGFSHTLGNAIESIGMTKYWLSEWLVLVGDWSIIFLERADITVTPNTNDQSTNLGCDDGLPYEVYVLSTMCLDLDLVVRSLDDFNGIQARFNTEASQAYFLDAFNNLILATGSPYIEYIDYINTDAATSVVSTTVTLVSQEYYGVLPSKEPTSMPTMAPTIFSEMIECTNTPCSCAELSPYCNICHDGQGCDECKTGYFKKDYNHMCQSCADTFGVGCISCQDFNGCALCQSGYERLFDTMAGVWYCQRHESQFIDDDWKFDRYPTCQCPYECRNDPCSCSELEHCNICHEASGCDECDAGYFKKDYNTPCLSCVETFGASCMQCSDFNGCQQCINGYTRTYDENCGLYYCKQD